MKIRHHAALAALALALAFTGPAFAKIRKFKVNQPRTRNLGVWRLTHDPAIRDYANYHNTQCWSPDGRYTCYTHYGSKMKAGGKVSAEVHVVDLSTGQDRLVGKGINPRWARTRNQLFYCHYTGNGKPLWETGIDVIRYDADTGKTVLITHGVEGPGGTDSSDTWLYGTQRFRRRRPQFVTVRARNEPNSRLERVKGAPNMHAFVHVNPRYPLIAVRAKAGSKGKLFGMNRAIFNLDGSNVRIFGVMAEPGHQSWRGDGEFWLFGNRQLCGRPWNKPYPSDMEIFGWGGGGDVCPADTNGRYIVYGGLGVMDTRSGDCWGVIAPHSNIVFPMRGDNSTLMDIDPKGSPDATKIHYHSTRRLDGAVSARVTKYDKRKQPDVIHVDSTDGFSETGDIVCRWEVVGYARKTAKTFEGLTRRKYASRAAPDLARKVRVVWPLSAFTLTPEERKRALPNHSMVRAGIKRDNPLLYQRQTNCYVVVARMPFRPHLRMKNGRVELIPGENHCETRGYRILRQGKPVTSGLVTPGKSFRVSEAGAYTVVAVEWSGLESPPSLPLKLAAGAAEGVALKEKPEDFSWTREAWQVNGAGVSRDRAMQAPAADMEIVHLHDGVIARETWRAGKRVARVDLNEQGKPIRFQKFVNGRLVERVYKTPEGVLSSREIYGPDGFKTEYIKYYTRVAGRGREARHWWYDHGRPIKRTRKGRRVVFDATKGEAGSRRGKKPRPR